MSRQIDLSKPLSKDDRRYLLDRDRYNDLAVNEQLLSNGEVDPFNLPDGLPSQVPQGADVSPQAVPAAVGERYPDGPQTPESGAGTDPGSANGSADPADDDEDDDEDNYDDVNVWSYDDLKSEVSERLDANSDAPKIALNSRREDFIAWLRKDDASDSE